MSGSRTDHRNFRCIVNVAALDKAFRYRRDPGLMRFQMLTGDTLAFSYSRWVILLRNSLAHERQINLSVVAVGR